MREETRCRHLGYSFQLGARVLLYASSHRQDNTYHSLCYTSHGTLAGTRNTEINDNSNDVVMNMNDIHQMYIELLQENEIPSN